MKEIMNISSSEGSEDRILELTETEQNEKRFNFIFLGQMKMSVHLKVSNESTWSIYWHDDLDGHKSK